MIGPSVASRNLKVPQSPRRKIITFEFGKHIDLCFVNLEGHGSPNLLKMKS